MFNRLVLTVAAIAFVFFAAATLYLVGAPRLAPSVAQAGAPDPAYVFQQQTSAVPSSGISVSGQGTANTKPNIAIATIGVEITTATLNDATTQANTKMNAVIDKIKSLGVADKDIQTSNYSLYPITSQPRNPQDNTTPTITGYRVSNQVRVTIRNLNDLGKILDSAVTAGANNIYGVSFGVDDLSPYQQQARAAAIKDAQDKAAQLAKAAGIQVGPVIEISEVTTNPVPLVRSAAASMAFPAGGATDVPVQTGEMQVMVNVTVRFGIK